MQPTVSPASTVRVVARVATRHAPRATGSVGTGANIERSLSHSGERYLSRAALDGPTPQPRCQDPSRLRIHQDSRQVPPCLLETRLGRPCRGLRDLRNFTQENKPFVSTCR